MRQHHWLRRKTNNGLLLVTIQLFLICYSYQRATSCLLSAVEYHFTPQVTLDFEHGHLSRAINATPGFKQVDLVAQVEQPLQLLVTVIYRRRTLQGGPQNQQRS